MEQEEDQDIIRRDIMNIHVLYMVEEVLVVLVKLLLHTY